MNCEHHDHGTGIIIQRQLGCNWVRLASAGTESIRDKLISGVVHEGMCSCQDCNQENLETSLLMGQTREKQMGTTT